MEETKTEGSPLKDESGNEVIEANGGPAVRLEEHHEEAETNEDHDVNVLESGVESPHLLAGRNFECVSRHFFGMHRFSVLGACEVQDNHDNFADQEDCLEKSARHRCSKLVMMFHSVN